jgi:Na+/melibiose symporter-like transporter
VLCALGLALVVFGVLEASTWGWLQPRNSPIEPFGFSLTPFVIAAGLAVIGGFRAWERRRERVKEQPLVHFRLLQVPAMRSGLTTFLFQNLILMGVFFAIPLYLQVVQGFDAFQTGVRMLPVSVTLFMTALVGARLARRYPARTIVRTGLGLLLAACLLLLATIKPEIETVPFAIAMAVLGIGMGLIVSQLGNVVQSAVGDEDRSEAGGLQFTAQQLGAAMGTALIGAIVISGLIAGFSSKVESDARVSAAVKQQVGIKLEGNVSFVSIDQVRAGAQDAGLDAQSTEAIVESYAEAQLTALKTGLLVAGLLVCAAFFATRSLPSEVQAARPPPAVAT